MSQPIFIEILARNGDVMQRHRFTQVPLRIGRAYDNDLILDDPHVAPHHATLEDIHGELVLRAGDTRNGLVVGKQRHNLIDLDGHTLVRLGHTRLRVRRTNHRVAPEVADSTNHGWEGLLPAFCGLGIAALVALASQWLAGTTATEIPSLVTEATTMLLMVIIWSSLWALANRLFAGTARFGRHLFIASLGYLLDELWTQTYGIVAYRFSWEFLDRYSDIFYLLPIALAVYFHLITVNPRLPKRMAAITLGITLASTTMILTNTYVSSGTLANKAYMAAPYLPGLKSRQTEPLEAFLIRAETMKSGLDELRQKAEQ